MPSKFDEFKPWAASDFIHPNEEIRENLETLQFIMEEAKFFKIRSEWWHFVEYRFRDYWQEIEIEP